MVRWRNLTGRSATRDSPAPPPAQSIGAVLRQARETRGHSVDEVVETLRIRRSHLEAIEADRFDDLPGRVYAIGYLRAYADFLQADTAALLERFKRETSGQEQRTELVIPTPPPEGRLPGGAVMLVAVLLAVVVYSFWYYLSANDRSLADLMPALPGDLAALLDDGAGDAPVIEAGAVVAVADEAEPVDVAYEPSAAAANEVTPETIEDLLGALAPSPAPDAAAASEVMVARGTPGQTILGPSGLLAVQEAVVAPDAAVRIDVPADRVTIRAVADSWVQVGDRDGRVVMTQLMRAGESYDVPVGAGMTLDTGNAGGLEIRVGDRVVPPLGGSGQVVRDIVLDPQRLLSGAAPLD